MLVQAVLIGFIAMFVTFEWMLGTNLGSRPIITGVLVGLVMGDLKTGIILGATLEMVFIGSITLGAAVPPDVITGGILGAAFAISTGKGADVALALAFPIATLYLVVDNLLTLVLLPVFVHKADRYVEEGEFRKMEMMHILGGFVVKSLPRGIICAAAFYLTGVLVGLVMGDLKTGIILGATLEMVFIGSITLGAAVPPDVITGGILGAAFAISTGKGADVALALAFPIATLYLVVDNLLTLVLLPVFVHKADRYVEEGEFRKMEMMHILGGFVVKSLPRGIICAAAFYLGTPVMNRVLESIPEFVQNGLVAAAGFIPALGIALLTRMILTKKTVVFFVLGFTISAYLRIPMLGIALLASVLAVILVELQGSQTVVRQEVMEDEDF